MEGHQALRNAHVHEASPLSATQSFDLRQALGELLHLLGRGGMLLVCIGGHGPIRHHLGAYKARGKNDIKHKPVSVPRHTAGRIDRWIDK